MLPHPAAQDWGMQLPAAQGGNSWQQGLTGGLGAQPPVESAWQEPMPPAPGHEGWLAGFAPIPGAAALAPLEGAVYAGCSWQTIALPVGVPPPEGAIPVLAAPAALGPFQPVSPAGGEGAWHAPGAPGAPAAAAAATGPNLLNSAHRDVGPQKRNSHRYKIIDPSTGKEIQTASRPWRIVDPKTGKEVAARGPPVPVPAG